MRWGPEQLNWGLDQLSSAYHHWFAAPDPRLDDEFALFVDETFNEAEVEAPAEVAEVNNAGIEQEDNDAAMPVAVNIAEPEPEAAAEAAAEAMETGEAGEAEEQDEAEEPVAVNIAEADAAAEAEAMERGEVGEGNNAAQAPVAQPEGRCLGIRNNTGKIAASVVFVSLLSVIIWQLMEYYRSESPTCDAQPDVHNITKISGNLVPLSGLVTLQAKEILPFKHATNWKVQRLAAVFASGLGDVMVHLLQHLASQPHWDSTSASTELEIEFD